MSVYVILILIACSGLFFNVNRSIRSRKRYLILVFGCLLFVAMFRDSSVGTDLSIYYSKYFPYFKDASWSDVQNVTRSGHWEWGFCAFCKAIGYISTNVQCFIIFSSILSIVPYAIFIYKNSEDVVFSTIFYLAFHVYMNSFNIVRQAMAVGIVLMGMESLKRKQHVKFCVYVAVASMIHTSAIISILFIIADFLEFKKTTVYWLTLGTIGFVLGYDTIFNLVLGYVGLGDTYGIYQVGVKHAAGYVTFHTLGMFMISAIIFALTVFSFNKKTLNKKMLPSSGGYTRIIVSKFKIKKVYVNAEEIGWSEDMFVFVTYLAMLFRISAFLINVASRMSYFFIPFLAIAFPHVRGKLSNDSNKKMITALVYGAIFLFFFYIGFTRAEALWGTVPFKFCW